MAPSHIARQAMRCLAKQDLIAMRNLTRTLSTEANSSSLDDLSLNDYTPPLASVPQILPSKHTPPTNPFITEARCTLHTFPGLKPAGYTTYPSTHLLLPLRRDILHRAVVWEADAKRSGTANTKWRGEVHGSGKKVRPQKGTGKARVGDRKSPVLRGGGVAHGPKPRDFSTDLPRKMYDLAWRTALSYRYRRGQLIVVKDTSPVGDIITEARGRYVAEMLKWHKYGHDEGRTLIVTSEESPALEEAFQDERASWEGEFLAADDVDMKDLLELGRIMIEEKALEKMLLEHESDLTNEQSLQSLRARFRHGSPSKLDVTSRS